MTRFDKIMVYIFCISLLACLLFIGVQLMELKDITNYLYQLTFK